MTKQDKRLGQAILEQADAGVARLAARAVVPPLVSPNIIAAPARGHVEILRGSEVVMTASGPRVHAATVDGFHAVRAETALDGMVREARPSKAAKATPLFTDLQRDTARAYAALHERVHAAGVRCSSVEAVSQGGSGGGSFIDAVIADHDHLRRMQASIGDGLVLIPRNAQAHADRGRTAIRVRDLVDRVCLGGQSLSAVLVVCGWSVAGSHRARLRDELARALDRMQRVTG